MVPVYPVQAEVAFESFFPFDFSLPFDELLVEELTSLKAILWLNAERDSPAIREH